MDPILYFDMVNNIFTLQKKLLNLNESATKFEQNHLEELMSLIKSAEQTAILSWLHINN